MTKDDKSFDVDDGETGKDDKKNEDEHDDVDGEQQMFFSIKVRASVSG